MIGEISIVGYPTWINNSKREKISIKDRLYSDKGAVLRHEWNNGNLSVYYDIHTSTGQSGAAL
jgi:hypothetical protein